jgi:nitroreductase
MTVETTPLRIAEYPVHDQFLTRWSPRAFTTEAMAQADVLSLLEAARWAPSASNLQPWRFVWALRGEAGFAGIADALVPFNRGWADKAAALIVVASATTTPKDGTAEPNAYHAFDSGAAWAQLALQAHLHGWKAHGMAGFDHGILADNVNLPADHVLHAVVAVGRQGDPATLPPMLQAREHPNQRLPLAAITAHGRFSQS